MQTRSPGASGAFFHPRRQLLANAAMAASRVAVHPWFVQSRLAEGQGPHPRRSYWRGSRLEDAADIGAIGEHIRIVIAPLAGARGRRAFQDEVVLLHRNTVARSFLA